MLQLVNEAAGPVERPVPYDLAAERGVLGSLLLDRDGVIKAATFLQPRHFYREAHAWIYAAILALYARREPPDLITLSSELNRRTVRLGTGEQSMLDAVGGMAYLAQLMHDVPTALHIEYYGNIVKRGATDRRRISVGGELAALGYRTDLRPDQIQAEERRILTQLRDDLPQDAWISLADVWATNLTDMEARQAGKVPPGVPTGFPTLDAHTQGWQPGDLIILAARTSRGKSALALHFAAAAAAAGRQVGMVSLEARKEAMGLRLLARESGVDLGTLRGAGLNDQGWARVVNATADANAMAERIWFLDSPTQTVPQVEAFVEQLRADATKGCDLLIVDYLQLLRGTGSTRESEVAGISRGLKLLGMQANLPVIALAQLNRAALGADAPDLHHLRESGAVEQDANIAIMLHRPNEDDPRRMHLLLRKQRDGVADIAIPLDWQGALQKFEEA